MNSIRVCIVILLFLTITGCWDTQDIKDRAFITAIGIDDGEEFTYKLSFEIIRPTGLRPQAEGPASILQTIEADSIQSALEQLQARISRRLTLAHLRVVIVGEDQAKDDILGIVDFFQRHENVQLRINMMFVQDGQAVNLLKAEPLLERYLSAELVGMTQVGPDLALVTTNRFFKFIEDLRSTGGIGLKPRILVSDNEQLAIRHGGAIFDQWKLIGWLSHNEAQAASWIVGDANICVDRVFQERFLTYLVDKKTVRITPIVAEGQLSFVVKLTTNGAIRQVQGKPLSFDEQQTLEKIESLFANIIADQVYSAIHKSQQDIRVDYLGFGTVLKQRKFHVYDQLEWKEVFATIPITVEVDTRITRFGMGL